MKLRLLLIFAISVFCTSFLDAAAVVHQDETSVEIQYSCISDTIDSPEQTILVPRQTDCTSHTQTRTVAKRYLSNRLIHRYVAFISGKAVDKSFIETYQLTFKSFSSGLLTPYRHYLSIGRLII